MIAGRPVSHPVKPRGRLGTGGRGGRVWTPPDTCPLSRPTPSSLTITFLSIFFLSSSQQGDKVRLVGHIDLRANRYHTFNATAVSHRAGGPPAALPAPVSDPRCEPVETARAPVGTRIGSNEPAHLQNLNWISFSGLICLFKGTSLFCTCSALMVFRWWSS